MKQQSFTSLEQAQKKKQTKREIFPGEMDAVMLRIYFLQQWYGFSDPGAKEALYDIYSMRDFAVSI